MRYFLIVPLLLLSIYSAASNLISSDADLERIDVGNRLLYLPSTRDIRTDRILENPNQFDWKKSLQDIPNYGFQSDPYWFWLELTNEGVSNAIWYLEINYPLLDDVQVYIQKNNGDVSRWRTGDQHYFEDRPIHHRNFVFPIYLDMLQDANVFIRVKTDGTMQIPATLWSENSFYREQHTYSIPHGTFIGLFIVIIIYNLFLGFTVREKSYFYYVTFATAFLGFFLGFSGYGYQYIWSHSQTFQQYSVLLFIDLALLGLILFTLNFLRINKTFSKSRLFLQSIVFACTAILLLMPFIPYKYMIQSLLITCIYSSVICIWTGIQSIHRLGMTAGIYTSAWAFLALGMGLLSLNKLGVIDNTVLIDTIMSISAGLMSLMLSFALGYRIQEEQSHRQEAERQALKSQKEALKARLKANEVAFESEQIRISAEAESKAKNEFLAMMSHEIRTPLNGIMGMSDLLKSTSLDTQQKRYANTIYSSGESLLTIINDILDFSKIMAGKLDIENVPVNLFELMDNCTSIFSKQVRTKGLYLSSSIYPPQDFYIQSDPVRLRQVILNFLSNASKFTQEGAIELNLLLDEEKETLRIEVIDSGLGISKEQQKILFNAFSQADSSITRNYGGTGLGLAICKKLSELMNGKTGVSSIINKGSTFWFECKVDILDTGLNDSDEFKNKHVGIMCEDQLTLDFLHEHIESWSAIKHDMQDINLDTQLDYLFIDHNDFLKLDIESVKKQLNLPRNHIIDIGDFNEESDLRLPLTTAALYKSMKLNQEASTTDLQLNQTHDENLPLNGLNILVAEDNSVNQMVIQALLKKLGAESTIAENGQQAFDTLEKQVNNFDLVLMDCEMPIVDGFTGSKNIRNSNIESVNQIPIIALTAHAMDIHRKKAKESGMDSFLSKPIKRQDLIQAVIDTINKKSGLL